VALLMWAAAVDGVGRPAAIGGSACCLGLRVAEPLARVLTRKAVDPSLPGPLAVLHFALLHLGAVYVGSRVAGLRHDPLAAAVIGGGALVAATMVLALASSRWPGPARASHDRGDAGVVTP
jgi:hypothetical protein